MLNELMNKDYLVDKYYVDHFNETLLLIRRWKEF